MENEGWQKIVLWASFVFFLGALLLRQEAAINQDLGRHLRLGEMIVAGDDARKCALYSNCLTYTYSDYPFVNHHWGAEVIFYFLYKLGGFGGLILFKALILAAAFTITALHAVKIPKGLTSKGSTLLRLNLFGLTSVLILMFLAVQMMADRLTTRPEIFGYLLFSLLFWLLDEKDLSNWRNLPNLMAIPIIMILWVNLHISFVFGLILIWIWSLSALIKQGPTLPYGKVGHYQALAIPAISTLVTIFNPAGLRGGLMPFSIMKDYGYTIVENMAPFFLRTFKPQPEYWIYAGLMAATLILALVTGKLGKFAGLVLLVFSIFPLMAVRHLPFFALVIPVVLAPLTRSLLAWQGDSWSISEKFAKLPFLVAIGLFLAATTNPVALAYAKLPPPGLTEDKRHEQAVKFVKDNLPRLRRDKPVKMWNNYDIGSYLEWALPEYKTFVDGRPEAFPAGFFQETYIPIQQSKQKWDEIVSQYDIQWVFAALTDATPWFQKWRQMIGVHEDWKVVYIDKSTTILARKDGINQSIKPTRNSILEIYGY